MNNIDELEFNHQGAWAWAGAWTRAWTKTGVWAWTGAGARATHDKVLL